MNENAADAPMSAEEFLRLCESGTPEQIEAAIKACMDDVNDWGEDLAWAVWINAERIMKSNSNAYSNKMQRSDAYLNILRRAQNEWFKKHPGLKKLFKKLDQTDIEGVPRPVSRRDRPRRKNPELQDKEAFQIMTTYKKNFENNSKETIWEAMQ